jgi:DNA topoisomerase-1
MGDLFVSLKGDDDVLTVGLNRAVDLIDEATRSGRAGQILGSHPGDGKPVRVRKGRFGAFVEHAGTRASLPKGVSPESVTLADALALLATKSAAVTKPSTKKAASGQRSRSKTAGGRGKATKAEVEVKERSVRASPKGTTDGKDSTKKSRKASTRAPSATKNKVSADKRADRARNRSA